MAKKPSEVRKAIDVLHEEVVALAAAWEKEIDDGLDEQAIPPGGCFEHDLVCPMGTDAGAATKAVEKIKVMYKNAGWKDIRVGPCINAVFNCEPVAHITLGIPVAEVKKAEIHEDKAKTVEHGAKAEELKAGHDVKVEKAAEAHDVKVEKAAGAHEVKAKVQDGKAHDEAKAKDEKSHDSTVEHGTWSMEPK